MKRAAAFFAYARKRQQILLDRQAGLPSPWSTDRVLQRYPFCNVFREDDRVTRWFRERVRDPLRDRPEVLLATVVFRMFNRIETGEAIFCDDDLLDESSAFFEFARSGKVAPLKRAILARTGKKGPYVTGAYIISTPPGYSKLDGVLEILRRFWNDSDWRNFANEGIAGYGGGGFETLEGMWEWLKGQSYLGRFHSYEIVTDLRHTALLERAPDVMTWANPGPGARRGLSRVWGRGLDLRPPREEQIDMMGELLLSSRDATMWPQFERIGQHDQSIRTVNKVTMHRDRDGHEQWPRWELRDVEHTLCEFDKYERLRLGQGRSKRIFRGGGA